jgi:hypothetical protein
MNLVPQHGRENIWEEDVARDGEDRKEDKEEDVEHDDDGGDDAEYMVRRFPR